MSSIIDGKSIAKEIELELTTKVSKMQKAPRLSVIQVGDDPASASYIKAKGNVAKRVGINLTILSVISLIFSSSSSIKSSKT